MTGMEGREDPSMSERDAQNDDSSARTAPPMSRGLFNSLMLVLIGASIGVFWREVFQLTVRAIEAFR